MGKGVKEGVFFFLSFFLGPPFSWGWLEWCSHELPTLVIINKNLFLIIFLEIITFYYIMIIMMI
jgi:hypothetical protein